MNAFLDTGGFVVMLSGTIYIK
ncbi:hypothetical protein DESC_120166 [Desulfosarcina cetonica]|nr:hypothetical protein DESC_120166 [Desulfosarcina cetonica]